MTTNPKSERPVRKAKREDFNETNCREVIANLNNTKPHPPPPRREPEKKQIEQPA